MTKILCVTCAKKKICQVKQQFYKKACRWGIVAMIIKCNNYKKEQSDGNATNQKNATTK